MGRAIVAGESVELGEWSRLWDPDDARQVIENKLFGLNFNNLGNSDEILNLTRALKSSIRKLPDVLGELRALKELDIQSSSYIQELPPLGRLASLEKMNISHCRRLRSVPESIGELKCLKYLEMNGCRSISRLPEEFRNMEKLRDLFMNSCRKLSELPQSFGNLVNLKHMEMKNIVKFIELPSSISRLESLVQLEAPRDKLKGDLHRQIGEFKTDLLL
eukprot:Gb_14275 [translate_table: standard]